MKGRFRVYGDRDLPALGGLFARADSHDGVARALAPDAADELPLFAFAPRYPLGLERGLTRDEVRSRLGSRLAEVERLVLVAAEGAAVDACVTVFPAGSEASWMLDWVVDPGKRETVALDEIVQTGLDRIQHMASKGTRRLVDDGAALKMSGAPAKCSVEARGLREDGETVAGLSRAGFQAVRTFAIMACELASLTAPALFDPGDQWMYGTSIEHVGRIVEEVSGLRLGEYLHQHILGPLGMVSTAFRISGEMRARKAAIHVRTEDGSFTTFDFEMRQEPEVELGGAGLYGTVEDYSRFLQMILGRGRRDGVQVLRPDTVDRMVVNNMGNLRVVPLPTAMPGFSGDAEFYPGTEKSWGLTFQINEEPLPTGRPAGGLMWAGLANSYYWIDMENQVAGTYISQQFPFADPRSFRLFEATERAYYASIA